MPNSTRSFGAKNKTVHLLAIRLSAMGDVAMTVPVLSALLRQHPETRVTLLTRPFFAPIFAQLPNVDVFAADVGHRHKGLDGLWRLYRDLVPKRFDGIADLHYVLRSRILDGFFRASGHRVATLDKGRAGKKALTAAKHKKFVPLETTHERYADVFRTLGLPLDLGAVTPLSRLPLPDKANGLGGGHYGKWAGIAPFAAFKGKTYPLDLMEQVISGILEDGKYTVWLFGGGGPEQRQLELWERRFENCICVAGKFDFPQELALISNLDAMLSMDSGNGHLAAMYGVPTITLWGVTHPYAGFAPFGQKPGNALLADREKYPLIPTSVYGNKCPPGYENAMASIPPGGIVSKMTEVLGE